MNGKWKKQLSEQQRLKKHLTSDESAVVKNDQQIKEEKKEKSDGQQRKIY